MFLLDRLIAQFPTAKRQTLKQMVQDRRILVNGNPAAKLAQPINPEDVIRVLKHDNAAGINHALPFRIIFEDPDILVIDKPPGLLTSTVPHEKRTTALALARQYVKAKTPIATLCLIHRLDRDASGLLIFSKNDLAYQSLKSQFFDHTVKRIYTAIVTPIPSRPWGRIESNLVEWADGTVRSARMKNKGQPARTDYAVTRQGNGLALLKVTLHTGRKHQIRAHLSERGHPIVGDTIYGGRKDPAGLMLAATELSLQHPRTGETKEFRIDPPARMNGLLAIIEV